jgi:hypothetical protein
MTEETIKALDELKNLTPQFEEIARQTVAYELWSGVLWVAAFSAVFFCCCVPLRWAIKRRNQSAGWDADIATTVFIASLFLCVVMFAFIVGNAIEVIKCLVAPELVILDAFSVLVPK